MTLAINICIKEIQRKMSMIVIQMFYEYIKLFKGTSLKINVQLSDWNGEIFFRELTSLLLIYIGGGLVSKPCPTLATPWTVALQAPLSMGFSRQEYWSISFSRGSSQSRNQTYISCISCICRHENSPAMS